MAPKMKTRWSKMARTLRLPKVGRNLRRNFVAGILVLVPLVATILILKWLFGFFDGILGPVFEFFLGRDLPGAGFVALLIIIYVAGLMTTFVLGRRAIRYGESLMAKLPMAREIYNTSRQVMESLLMTQKGGFREVVLVEFPRPGIRTIGFVTNRVRDTSGQEFVNVYIPTAPNPTSGFLQIIPVDQVVRTDIDVEDAIKMVVSGGMVSPATIEMGAGRQTGIQ